MKFKECSEYLNFYLSKEDLNQLKNQEILRAEDNYQICYSPKQKEFSENKFFTKFDSLFILSRKGLINLLEEGKILEPINKSKGLAIFTPKIHKGNYNPIK